tara:strand:+ start:386 stop:556 length:171 start_codon:yes stop_codon:yes gene_type:complete
MNIELGSEGTRAILLKYRRRLKYALSEHEAVHGESKQIVLLAELCEQIEREIEQSS